MSDTIAAHASKRRPFAGLFSFLKSHGRVVDTEREARADLPRPGNIGLRREVRGMTHPVSDVVLSPEEVARQGLATEVEIRDLVSKLLTTIHRGHELGYEEWHKLQALIEQRLQLAYELGGSPVPNLGPENRYILDLRRHWGRRLSELKLARREDKPNRVEELLSDWLTESTAEPLSGV